MNRMTWSVFLVTLLAASLTSARSAFADAEHVKTISARDLVETLDGKPVRATTVEVRFEPGEADRPHRHAGPILGYVLEGELEFAVDEEAPRTLKTGDTFYEPSGALHRIARNPSATNRTRVLAVILHPRDAKSLTSPVEDED